MPAPGITELIKPYEADDFNDRGAAQYFHGREEHRRKFARLLRGAARDAGNGTAILIQGPPGVGKTALLFKLEEDAEALGWRVVKIEPEALKSPAGMAEALGTAHIESRAKSHRADAKFLSARQEKQIVGIQSVVGILRDQLHRKDKIVLVLDEGQHLAEPSSDDAMASIRAALNSIINGSTRRKVVLLIGGLSHTWTELRKRGVSRLRRGCVGNLKRVADDTANRIVHDWLVEIGCSPQHLETWQSVLVRASDNWPQHIMCCVAGAIEHFVEHGDTPTEAAIQSVLDSATKDKRAFYEERVDGLPTDDVALLGMLVGACGFGEEFGTGELIEVLRIRSRDGDVSAGISLELMVAQGVLANRRGGAYFVPVPTMERHLVAQAIDHTVRTPVHARDLWEKVRELILSKRGRVRGDVQKQLQEHFINVEV
ncbi:MAG: ATP-binding protein [Bacteroidota bacterium]|nr:ATP-binding protein [Bacteroidota bacterium]